MYEAGQQINRRLASTPNHTGVRRQQSRALPCSIAWVCYGHQTCWRLLASRESSCQAMPGLHMVAMARTRPLDHRL